MDSAPAPVNSEESNQIVSTLNESFIPEIGDGPKKHNKAITDALKEIDKSSDLLRTID